MEALDKDKELEDQANSNNKEAQLHLLSQHSGWHIVIDEIDSEIDHYMKQLMTIESEAELYATQYVINTLIKLKTKLNG